MAELVDAADSKSAVRKDVQVRFLFRALLEIFVTLFTIAVLKVKRKNKQLFEFY